MIEWMEECHKSPHKPATLQCLFHPFRIGKWTFNEVHKSVKVPFRIILVRDNLTTVSVAAQELSCNILKRASVSTMRAWKALSSNCMPSWILLCSTCRCPRRTGSSTELALQEWSDYTLVETVAQTHLVLLPAGVGG